MLSANSKDRTMSGARLLIRFLEGNTPRWAELRGKAPAAADDVVDVAPFDIAAASTAELIAALDQDAVGHLDSMHIAARQLLSPITADATLVCQGLNYADHANEASHGNRKSNLIFGKASSSICGPHDDILRPPAVELLDYEVEFALVMRAALLQNSHVTEDNIADFVAGVVLCNDVSARDIQFGESLIQWFRGKSYRTFCPTGPLLCLPEKRELASLLRSLEVKLWVNGGLRQSATSAQLVWKPVETLNYLRSFMNLKPGDLLLTGTPGGVTAPVTPAVVEIVKTHLFADDLRLKALRAEMTKGRPFLQPGDVVTASLRDCRQNVSLGGQQNKVAASPERG
jgi:2-keto-4-pentenoate hydratase/2-oxohepta-3-ene-1,7-dioic acid hydratase in catechol pathway